MQKKQLMAALALRWLRRGMHVGFSSCSTAACYIALLSGTGRNGQLQVQATATSLASQKLARQVGIPLLESRRGLRGDLTVEGTDELDAQPRLVKGGGATLLREKVLAPAFDYLLIIADFSKVVAHLGQFSSSLKVVPSALPGVLDAVAALGGARCCGRASKKLRNPLVDYRFNVLLEPSGSARNCTRGAKITGKK